jgi:hypothetical protein
MTTATTRRLPDHGLRLWYSQVSGIVWWTIHVNALAALTRLACDDRSVIWVMHAVTVVTAAGTGLALWWSWMLVRSAGEAAEVDGSPAGRRRFLGLFGLLVSAISLLLILWEGAYVLALDPCV